MKKNLRAVIWYLIALAGCIFTMTIFGTVEGAPRIGWAATILVFLIQLAGLAYHMHAKADLVPAKPIRILLILLRVSILGVIGCFGIAVFSLANEYHNPVEAAESADGKANITVEEVDDLYIMYPGYTTVDFVIENRPSRSDESITFCAAAEFQKTYNLSFNSAELPGTYVSGGKKYTGYTLSGLGAFAFYDGTFHFANEEEAEAEIDAAYAAGGSAFQQILVIDDGEIIRTPAKEYRCFRVLAELNGKLCVIDSKVPMYYTAYAEELQAIGVTHALYMDMGSGWNYSWYRDNLGKARTLIGMYWPFEHNWIVFKWE